MTSTQPRCDGCHRTAAGIAAAHGAWAETPKIAAGLQLCWWIPRGRGWQEAHYCDRCAPDGSIWPVACGVCLDGPFIVLTEQVLPGMPTRPAERRAAYAHLRWLGWQLRTNGTFLCPDCRSTSETHASVS